MRKGVHNGVHDGDGLPAGLQPAVEILREDVEPNDIWRQRLLRQVEEVQIPRLVRDDTRTVERRWSVRPWVAVAAGVACMAVGAAAASIVAGRNDARVQVAAAPSVPRVRFTFDAPAAASVSIVGDFNGWVEGALPLRRSADGRTWEIEVPLAPGRYAYSFVVDGRLARDPSAPQSAGDDFGTPNSVIMVRGT